MKKQAVLSLSGGMDSSTVLLHLLANNYEVTAVSFNYGQKHNIELERAQQLVDYLEENGHQKNIKDAILKGRVHWHEHTADGIWEHETRKQHLKNKK